jgi:Flp pilus assembly protein TadG
VAVARRPERGSALLLFPAAILIMMALAAMAVDSSIAFLAQRELANAAAAAANDAASRAVSDASFYQQDRIELSAATVEQVAVDRVFSLVDTSRHHNLSVDAEALGPTAPGCAWTVRVTATSRVDGLFGRAMPGRSAGTDVRARASATPRQDSNVC